MIETSEILNIEEIPSNPKNGSVFLINANWITDYTHGFFKYPCKFIPHIPRWFIKSYKNDDTMKYWIIDPFMGSGTTLVEASLLNIKSYWIDIDPLSILISKAKTSKLNKNDLIVANKFKSFFKLNYKKEHKYNLLDYTPKISNLNHWFSNENIWKIGLIKAIIMDFSEQNNNKKISNFLLTVFASIIRKSSFADEQSPKPYISKRIIKEPIEPETLFLNNLSKYIKLVEEYSSKINKTYANIIWEDARKININEILYQKVHLAVTSPPYINAFDYVRSLKLENYWLDSFLEKDIHSYTERQIWTEKISSKVYQDEIKETGIWELDNIIRDIFKKDKKRAHVVNEFFNAMKQNLSEVSKILVDWWFYCIVIWDSKIRDVHIPSSKIISKIAKKLWFKLKKEFSYIIRNRYLRIPRQGKGGYISADNIIILQK